MVVVVDSKRSVGFIFVVVTWGAVVAVNVDPAVSSAVAALVVFGVDSRRPVAVVVVNGDPVEVLVCQWPTSSASI